VDVYSLGAILYEMLTGHPPFRAATPMDMLLQVMEREPEPPRTLKPHVDRDLETICLKCLEKEPQRRYSSAATLADDLERWLRHEPIQARPVARVRRLRQWVKRRPLVATVAALSVLLVLAMGGAIWLYVSAQRDHSVDLMTRAEEARQQGDYGRADALLDQCPWLGRGDKWKSLKQQIHGDRLATTHSDLMRRMREAYDMGNLDEAQSLLDQCPDETRNADWKEWKRSFRPPLQIVPLMARWNAGMVFSPNGQRLAVFDGVMSAGIRLFDTADWKVSKEIIVNPGVYKDEHGFTQNGESVSVASVVFSADSQRLAAITCPDRDSNDLWQIRIWNATGGKPISSIPKIGVRRLAFSADGSRVYGYINWQNDLVTAWNAIDGMEVVPPFSVAPPPPAISWDTHRKEEALAFSNDGRTFARGGKWVFGRELSHRSLPAQFWDTSSTKERATTEDNRLTPVGSFVFSGDLRLLAGYTQEDTGLHVWDTATGKKVAVFQAPLWFVESSMRLMFSADGRYLAIATREDRAPEVIVWDVTKERQIAHLRSFRDHITGVGQFGTLGHWGPFAGLVWHPSKPLLAVSTEREVRIFDIEALAKDE
jgi:WD40 repeat protein